LGERGEDVEEVNNGISAETTSPLTFRRIHVQRTNLGGLFYISRAMLYIRKCNIKVIGSIGDSMKP